MNEIEKLIAKLFSEGKAYLLSIGMDEAPFIFKVAAGEREFKDFVRFAFLKAYDFEAKNHFDFAQYQTILGIYRSVTGELVTFLLVKECRPLSCLRIIFVIISTVD